MGEEKEHGMALPTVLFAVALLSVISALSWYFASQIVSMRQAAIHAYSAKFRAENGAIQLLFNKNQSALALEVLKYDEAVGLHNITREILVRNNIAAEALLDKAILDPTTIPDPLNFPLINFNQIFSDFTNCGVSPDPTINSTLLGFVLTPGAVYSSSVCIDPDLSAARFVIDKNLANTLEQELSADSLIAAAGYTDIKSTIWIRTAALFVTGGDLHIQRLAAEFSAAVTLVSATGVVVIDQIDPAVRVRAFAREGVYLPADVTLSADAQLAPILERVILGYRE